jgi:arylsulfatase A-like enzyme
MPPLSAHPRAGPCLPVWYPHSNGLIGLAHRGFEYREGVRTLPQILSDAGWYSVLYGMQHETSYPSQLGFDEFDMSNCHCEYVIARAMEWLTESAPLKEGGPFLLTAGFFETHRPWPRERYEPAPLEDVDVPDYLPDIAEVRGDFADFYGAIAVADAAVGRLLDTLADTGLDANPWGRVLQRPRCTVSPHEGDVVRRRQQHFVDHPPAQKAGIRAARL